MEPIVVVCVPGTLCAPDVFAPLADRVSAPDVRVETVSWLTQPGPWHLSGVAARISASVRDRHPGARIVLLGHSTGGAIALRTVAADPELAAGLVLIDTGPTMRGHGDVEAILAAIEAGGVDPVLGPLLDRSFDAPLAPETRQRFTDYARSVPAEAVLEVLRSQRDTDLTPVLPDIWIPALVVHGRADRARRVRDAEHLVDGLRDARLVLTDTGHSPMWDAPDPVAAAVTDLIARCRVDHQT